MLLGHYTFVSAHKREPMFDLTHLFRESLLGILHLFREWVTEKSVPVEEPLPEDDLSEPTECLSCHRGIPAGAASCPGCGWSYK
jgi:hypothetical protein